MLPRLLIASTVLAFFSVLVFVFLIYYFDGLVDPSDNIFNDKSSQSSTASKRNLNLQTQESDLKSAYLLETCLLNNNQQLNLETAIETSDSLIVWGSTKNINSFSHSLYIVPPSSSLPPFTKCKVVHQGDPFGPILASPLYSHSSSDYLFMYTTATSSSSSFSSSSSSPIFIARTPLVALKEKEALKWEYWSEKESSFGSLRVATPILHLKNVTLSTLSVIWSPVNGFVLAYGDGSDIVILKSNDLLHFTYAYSIPVNSPITQTRLSLSSSSLLSFNNNDDDGDNSVYLSYTSLASSGMVPLV